MFAVTITASPIGLFFAFLGGVVSILSPCVLPILPGLIGIISGSTIDELENDKKLGRRIITLCTLFSIGFTSVFIVIGLATTELSQSFLRHASVATKVGGVFLIVFATILLINHVTNLSIFGNDKRPLLNKGIKDGGAVATGAAFAFGWSPCIGPILGGVLAYASTEHALIARVSIILAYCAGLCLAMSLVVYASFRYKRFSNFIKKHVGVFVWISIVIMYIFGLILLFDQMTWLTSEVTNLMDLIGLDRLVTIG